MNMQKEDSKMLRIGKYILVGMLVVVVIAGLYNIGYKYASSKINKTSIEKVK